MFKKSKSDSKSYGIIGLGRFGSALAVELAKSGAEPLVIDGNEEKVREMREYTENAFVVSSFDKKTLSETGIQNCDVVVVCIGEKMDTSILTTLNVVSLGVPTVISKAASAEQGEILFTHFGILRTSRALPHPLICAPIPLRIRRRSI